MGDDERKPRLYTKWQLLFSWFLMDEAITPTPTPFKCISLLPSFSNTEACIRAAWLKGLNGLDLQNPVDHVFHYGYITFA